jgi:hypothetical protein
MFNTLCGDDMLKNVIVTTTKWGDNEPSVELRREKQLSETVWKKMLACGSRMARFMLTHESAWEIIDLIVGKEPIDAFHSQELLEICRREEKNGEPLGRRVRAFLFP